MSKIKPYILHRDWLSDHLSDPAEAQIYLEVAIEDFERDGDQEAFLLAMRDVAEAQGGLGVLAARTHLNREHLYRALSAKGNPRLATVGKILRGLGYSIRLQPSVEPV